MWIPWLPADKIFVSPAEAFILAIVLGCFTALSSLAVEAQGLGIIRFFAALVQGYIVGHLLVFDVSTLFARLTFSLALGTANAIDRIIALRPSEGAEQTGPIQPVRGASGAYTYKGKQYKVVITDVVGNQIQIKYKGNPFLFSNADTIDETDTNLELQSYANSQAVTAATARTAPSFYLRPWGYALGVMIACWVISGSTRGDTFFGGLLAGQMSVIFLAPLSFFLVWGAMFCLNVDPTSMCCALCILLVGIAAMEAAAFVPVCLGLMTLSAVELYNHCIIEFLAIPIDHLVFFAIVRPNSEQLANSFLNQTASNAAGTWSAALRLTANVKPQPAVAGGPQAPLLQGSRQGA